jgi:hypothetical protein
MTTYAKAICPSCPHCGHPLHVLTPREAPALLYESLRITVSRRTIERYCRISPLPVIQGDQDKKVAVARWYRAILASPAWKRKHLMRDTLGNEINLN